MGKQNKFNHSILGQSVKALVLKLLIIAALIAGVLAFAIWVIKGCGVKTEKSGKIGITPVQITKIKNIGQWEFLAISDEELIDTIRHGFFGDDELARIYYGTLRLGIDLGETKEGWIKMEQDTVTVLLPPVKLLDHNFIDEARTKAFFEEGKWSEADKAKLTAKAARVMKARCMTPANIRSAEQNASAQFSNLLQSMGFKFSRIRFGEQNQP
ncbi:hypothetical protein HMPREF0645_1872 [Hallella bergensis DSM 17361]|uniref:DUF4230 domain-containing protein n=1 Tax=Hallella bergensis DSM 17361 TaxID=585502 RepID=D1PY37_9BACT|nr:DUF4230 domain-containing protein [Hallella bergensis]EFA43710.1 hypothetical protein HMPREF0645_1872 [Hallella bergensis DSM 17361]